MPDSGVTPPNRGLTAQTGLTPLTPVSMPRDTLPVPQDPGADAVFDVLADPTRRRLLAQIARAPATATELATDLPISRQAVAKHLSALSEAGLLDSERSGRDVRYHVTPGPLSGAVSWMAQVGGQWDTRLARLGSLLSEAPAPDGTAR